MVCDEFTEMLMAKPDFIDLFVQIGRIGRSIGVHLLLATQRLEEGRLRGLETNLSYRIALRTFTALESRMTLGGATDAAELPAAPGHGFLLVGTEPLQRFKAAYVSGPYRRARPPSAARPLQRMLDYTTAHVPSRPARVAPAPIDPQAPSLMEVIVGRLAGRARRRTRCGCRRWTSRRTWTTCSAASSTDPARGVTAANPSLRGALQVPVALVDKPFEQRRDVAWLDLAGRRRARGDRRRPAERQVDRGAHARHRRSRSPTPPQEVQVYCLDFGGGSLGSLRDLPHVGGVAGRLDTARGAPHRRRGGHASGRPGTPLRRRGIDSVATFRRLRRPSDLDATLAVPEDGFGDVFLVVDGWATLRKSTRTSSRSWPTSPPGG